LSSICADHQAVAAGILLVLFHDVGGHVPVGFVGVGADRRQRRQRLEAELAHEARVLVAVGGEGLAAVPHVPVVRVALRWPLGS
jgi:hypothetical protein